MPDNQPLEFAASSIEELNELNLGYEFIDFIAKGGMGAVYLAKQVSLGRLVAIKILPPVLCANEEFKVSFESEAKLMAKLNHANMIGVYDFGEVGGMLYIVMEFVKGKSLFESAGGMMIEQKTVVEIITGVCEGLEHAHEAGMLHRDVKPANIMLNRRSIPKIGDFGLARPSEMTESGDIFGTPNYAAPEVLGAPDKVDHRTDIYAVGVILYELLTGNLPSSPYVSVTEFADSDKRFDFIIKRAINKNIDLRHESAKELAEALKDLMEDPQSENKLSVGAGSNRLVTSPVAPPPSAISAPSLDVGASSVSEESAMMARRQAASPAKNSSNANAKFLASLAAVAILGGVAFVLHKKQSAKDAIIAEQLAEQLAEQQAEDLKIEEAKKAALAKEKAQKRKQERLAREKAQLAKEEARKKAKADKNATESVKVVILTPIQKLERLKEQFANGGRPLEEMPETMFKLGEDSRILMYIKTPMTWDKADTWAQKYGGYIAVATSPSDMAVLTEQIPDGVSSVWLGGENTLGDWAWLDGSPWTSSIALASSDKPKFVALSKSGKTSAENSNEECPFFIEWRADGSNPADLKARLARVGEAFGGEGSEAQYYVVKSLVSHDKAVEMATVAGGRLVAISGEAESKALSTYLKNNAKSGELFWTAATKVDQLWSWETGESWGKCDWINDGKDKGTCAVLKSMKIPTLMPVSADEGKYGFIIEWGKVEGGAVAPTSTFELSDIEKLKVKSREVVEKAQQDKVNKYASNIRNLVMDLRSLKRRLESKSSTKSQAKGIDGVIGQVDGEERLSDDLSGDMASAKANDYVDYAKKVQNRLDGEADPGVAKLREAFVAQLKKAHKQMEEAGQVGMAAFLEEEIGKVSDDDSFKSYIE